MSTQHSYEQSRFRDSRVKALEIQALLEEKFDTDIIGGSGLPVISTKLEVIEDINNGKRAAVRVIIDLPYFKDEMFLQGLDDGYFATEVVFAGGVYDMIADNYDNAATLIREYVRTIAVSEKTDGGKSFIAAFKESHRIKSLNIENPEVLLDRILAGKKYIVRKYQTKDRLTSPEGTLEVLSPALHASEQVNSDTKYLNTYMLLCSLVRSDHATAIFVER